MKRLAAIVVLSLVVIGQMPANGSRIIRVCADPNNLPFSNRAGEGFENRIAALLAADLHARLEYTWWPQRRGFMRHTLQAGVCDVVMGTAVGVEQMQTTEPYYRSSYVFVSRRDRHLALRSLADPRLSRMTIAVQMIGDDFANTPPAHALARRGIVSHVVGYSVFGDYSQQRPLAPIVEAVDRGDVDVAIVWGPVAGFFSQSAAHPLELNPVAPEDDRTALPFVFAISMGLRRNDDRLRTELDDFIVRRRANIDAILNEFGIPRMETR